MKIAIINGVNLGAVGTRETDIYGSESFTEYEKNLQEKFADEITFYQSDIEGEIVEYIAQAARDSDAIIINPGAYTHSSVAIADALRAARVPAVEVHISQVMAREPYRRRSYVAEVCRVSISGMGLYGYESAVGYLLQL